MVHTGKGKGKSTAAFGMVFRALGNGMKVGVVQFVKGKWQTGERQVLEKLGDQVTMTAMGRWVHLGNPGQAAGQSRLPVRHGSGPKP